MNWIDLVTILLTSLFVLVFLYAGVFIFLSLERLFLARIAHRDGPGLQGSTDYFQVWKDFRKSKSKDNAQLPLSYRYRVAVFLWKLLPALFLLALLGELFPQSMEGSKLMLILFLPILSTAFEAIFLHASRHQREKNDWKKRIQLRLMGGTLLALSFLTATLQFGSPNVSEISGAQKAFPFLLLFFSPGLFICCVASLGSIFLFLVEDPIQNESELSLGRSIHYSIFFVRRMWIFSLLSLWTVVFWGGFDGLLIKALFPAKLFFFLLMFILLQASFPKMRNSDAGELAIRWLLPLCLMGFLTEAIWVGMGR